MNLEDFKSVLITGHTKGIGKAIFDELDDSYIVYGVSRSSGQDLTTKNGLEIAVQLAKNCDILINNFGGGGTWKDDDFLQVMFNNYGVTNLLTKAYLSKPKTWGRVITISSIFGKEKGNNPGFTATKSAQIAYMKSLSGQYEGITFNTICPGYIDTGKFDIKPKVIGEPKDVAYLVNYLCSDKAKFINGACITVDGGFSSSF